MNMTELEIADRLVQEAAILLRRAPGDVRADQPLHELGLDSMAFVQLLVFIERQFGVNPLQAQIAPEDLSTLSRLAACIVRMKPPG